MKSHLGLASMKLAALGFSLAIIVVVNLVSVPWYALLPFLGIQPSRLKAKTESASIHSPLYFLAIWM